MKINEIRDLSYDELVQKLADLKSELFTLRFQNSTSQIENTARIADVKKSIARVKTIIREIEIKEGK